MKAMNVSERTPLQKKSDYHIFSQDDFLKPDDDLKRAIVSEELLAGIETDIREAFGRYHKA